MPWGDLLWRVEDKERERSPSLEIWEDGLGLVAINYSELLQAMISNLRKNTEPLRRRIRWMALFIDSSIARVKGAATHQMWEQYSKQGQIWAFRGLLSFKKEKYLRWGTWNLSLQCSKYLYRLNICIVFIKRW